MGRAIQAVFVYGTLKRGEVRAAMWPKAPLAVEVAEVRGMLFDLGRYPALVAGDERVGGELWHFAAEDLPTTLEELDRIEGYRRMPDDLYRREASECHTASRRHRAWTYRYARPQDL